MEKYADISASREEILGLIEAQAYLAMDTLSPDGGRLSFPAITAHEVSVDGIGCHYGIDRTLYYDLYSGDRKLISMNDWRFEGFFSETPESELRKIHDGIVAGLEKKGQAESPKVSREGPSLKPPKKGLGR